LDRGARALFSVSRALADRREGGTPAGALALAEVPSLFGPKRLVQLSLQLHRGTDGAERRDRALR